MINIESFGECYCNHLDNYVRRRPVKFVFFIMAMLIAINYRLYAMTDYNFTSYLYYIFYSYVENVIIFDIVRLISTQCLGLRIFLIRILLKLMRIMGEGSLLTRPGLTIKQTKYVFRAPSG